MILDGPFIQLRRQEIQNVHKCEIHSTSALDGLQIGLDMFRESDSSYLIQSLLLYYNRSYLDINRFGLDIQRFWLYSCLKTFLECSCSCKLFYLDVYIHMHSSRSSGWVGFQVQIGLG